MLLVVKVIGGRSRVSFQRQQAALGDLNGYIEEMIEGQKVIKVFHHEQQAIDQFSARNDTYQTAATMAQTYAGSMMPATANLSRINYAVTCCVGGRWPWAVCSILALWGPICCTSSRCPSR